MPSTLSSYWVMPLLVHGGLLLFLPWTNPRNVVARSVVVWLFLLLTLRYHYFRLFQTLPPPELDLKVALIYAFYLLELLTAYPSVLHMRGMIRRTDRTPEVEANLHWYMKQGGPPLVDVLIPTYNESLEVLESTILAARNLNYPRFRVWVLDDRRRDWLRAACEGLNVNYLRRPDNSHFKAGNLNHAIAKLVELEEKPEFLAILDADFIVLPGFIERTLALMQDPRTAVVQTPQRFYNPDPFQFAFNDQFGVPDDMRTFFEHGLPARDAEGAATCCGTSFLLRVQPLLEVGGFPTESVTEDTLLSIKLRGLGWKTVYLAEGLSYGLAPEGLSEYLAQRARWWLGGAQTALYFWKQIGPRLAIRRRLVALEALLRFATGPLCRLSWLVLPIVYWITGFSIMEATGPDLVSYILPLLATRMAVSWMSNGAVLPILTPAASLLGQPLFLRAALRVMFGSKNFSFNVTPKGINRDRLTVHWRTMAWLGLLAILLVGGLWYRGIDPRLTLTSSRFFLWNLYATYATLLVLLVAMAPCFERPQRRRSQRFGYGRPATIRQGQHELPAVAVDISLKGALIAGTRAPAGNEAVAVQFDPGGVWFPAKAVRTSSRDGFAVEFDCDFDQKAALIALIFYSHQCIPEPTRWTFWRCGNAMLRRAMA